MLQWLYTFPDLAISAFFVILTGLAFAGLPWLTRMVPLLAPNPANTDFVLRLQSTLFMLIGFALAVTLVQAQANIRRIEALCATEAALINSLDRLLARYDSPQAEDVRPKLRTYVESIVRDEWPAMKRGRESHATRELYVPVVLAVSAINPASGRQATFYAEILKLLDEVAEARETRIDAVAVSLPTVYWAAIALAMAVLLLAACAVEQTPFRTLFLAAQAAVLGAFIAIVFITDQPLKGQTSVGPDSFAGVLDVMPLRNR